MEFQPAMANAFDESNGQQEQATENTTVVRFGEVSEVTLQTQIANRVKRKAKRRGKILALNGGMLGNAISKGPESPTKLKAKVKDRHSRTGRRGLPKKGIYILQTHCIHYKPLNKLIMMFGKIHTLVTVNMLLCTVSCTRY